MQIEHELNGELIEPKPTKSFLAHEGKMTLLTSFPSWAALNKPKGETMENNIGGMQSLIKEEGLRVILALIGTIEHYAEVRPKGRWGRKIKKQYFKNIRKIFWSEGGDGIIDYCTKDRTFDDSFRKGVRLITSVVDELEFPEDDEANIKLGVFQIRRAYEKATGRSIVTGKMLQEGEADG